MKGLEKQRQLPTKKKQPIQSRIDSSQESEDAQVDLSALLRGLTDDANPTRKNGKEQALNVGAGTRQINARDTANSKLTDLPQLSNSRYFMPSKSGASSTGRDREETQAPSLQRSEPTTVSDHLQTPEGQTQILDDRDQPSTITHLSINPVELLEREAESASWRPAYSSPLQDKSTNLPADMPRLADGIARPVARRPDVVRLDQVAKLEDSALAYRRTATQQSERRLWDGRQGADTV